MKKYIIITTIFNPTEAIKKYSRLKDYRVIVVGDKKTPLDWNCENVYYISIKEQTSDFYKSAKIMPFNHYCRKMIGYIYAIRNGADLIIDTDDDNIPKLGYSFPKFQGTYVQADENLGFINIYKYFTESFIWPRGLPLKYISNIEKIKLIGPKEQKVGIWQGLADEDPDVDAVYRLVNNNTCIFKDREPIILGKHTISPFNSQNTAFRKELFPLLFLPTNVNFRFTDILRGMIAQPIMWKYGYKLGFCNASVVQKRNFHDYFKDFVDEVPVYLHSENAYNIVERSIKSGNDINYNLYEAYCSLNDNKIIKKRELKALEAWLKDIN